MSLRRKRSKGRSRTGLRCHARRCWSGLRGGARTAVALAVACGVFAAALLRMAMRAMRLRAALRALLLPAMRTLRRARLALALLGPRCAGVEAQRGGGLEAGHVVDGDLVLEQLADVAQQARLVVAHQR